MHPVFRKIRWRLAANNQFFKYSRYAIGEIVLVVIGILIALYINNWNENRKEREKFDQILVEVEKELVTNIKEVRNVLNYYAYRDSLLIRVLIDTLSIEDYSVDSNQPLFSAIYWYHEAVLVNESFMKLKLINNVNEEQDSILQKLTSLNINQKKNIDGMGVWMEQVMQQNRHSIEKYDWYKDWYYQRYDDKEMINYFVNDSEYLNNATKYLQVAHNYCSFLELYDIKGREVYREIHKYLLNKYPKEVGTLLFEYNPVDFEHYVGTFKPYFNTNNSKFVTDSTVISIESDKLFFTPFFPDGSNSKREIIPVNKYFFRTEFGRGFYRMNFDDSGNVVGLAFSTDSYVLRTNKIR